MQLTQSFKDFFDNEKSAGFCLMACAILALSLANSPLSSTFLGFWKQYAGGLSISHWVNDGLMAIFFLLIGLEIERELYNGELSDLKNAMLPIAAALGGIAVPALLYFALNRGLETQAGIGIPMATDIAFALSVLAILGSRAPASLKIFLTAVAIIDDLCAIIIIAVFYTSQFSLVYLLLALAVFGVLIALNRLRVMSLAPYLIGGALMWYLMLQSGVHATIAGVLIAFTIPFSAKSDDAKSPSYQLEHALHKPVAFFILPVFALANAGIIIGGDWLAGLTAPGSLGIIVGLFFGKVTGILLLSFIAVKSGLCRLPHELRWRHILGAGFLAGIGFTMSIFITNLAFAENDALINNSKMAILLASLMSGFVGYCLLIAFGKQNAATSET